MTTAPTAPPAFEGFDETAVSRWVERLSGNTSPRRNHWKTKEIYFEAATRVLDSVPRPTLNWKNIVAAADKGCRSTFYEVAGAHARHRMVDELINDGGSDAIQIALRYLRSDPVEQLIDETKVWSFWPYRQKLLRTITTGMSAELMETELTAALITWATRHRSLAAAIGFTPPACAVEDLTVIHRGRLSGTQAAARLTAVIDAHVGLL
ncbi:hypothetical protein Aab01nite_01970 [Paractinoplanes abujensis]|uniref:Uncharacterized protein n=1 Tax=Paractinoplanes abujensis TaxID=882441 RepID=A0A7W7G1A8_9ACTN|nr:hypothetical protein [Actinoplanes abujensis]MBB4691975.1 hypothetical protein [Actinoplanes abujensis]GID16607.1 hypothetical protein Aab01nite_01970 [Actinoplanes abujensis]